MEVLGNQNVLPSVVIFEEKKSKVLEVTVSNFLNLTRSGTYCRNERISIIAQDCVSLKDPTAHLFGANFQEEIMTA